MPTPAPEKHNRPWHLKFHLHNHDNESKKPAERTVITHHTPPNARKGSVELANSRRGSIEAVQKQNAKPLDFTKDIPMDIPYPPFLNVEGVPNFRDIGGYSSTTSKSPEKSSVRQGFAYRCSELSQITPVGEVLMTQTLKITTMFDLRSEKEAANPLGQPQGVKCLSTPVFRQQDVSFVLGLQQLTWSTAPDKPKNAGYSQGYVDWYRQIAVYAAKSSYRIIFEHIRDKPDEPFVFHCSAGKDRTGVLAAIILDLCGVDYETIAWEYSLTVPGMGVWEEAVEQEMVGDSMMPVRSHGGMTREEAHRVCGSRASNMERWLKVVLEKEFGGAAKYLKEQCKFTDEDVAKIKKNLMVPGEGPIKAVELPSKDHPQT